VTAAIALPFRIGARTLWRVRRRLLRVSVSLEEALGGRVPPLPQSDGDGYLVTSVPADLLPQLLSKHRDLRPFVRQRYRRCYADLGLGFDAYIAGFSAKSRSTLKRKVRRWASGAGGAVDLRCYRTVADVDEFHRLARALSSRTYQERLLDAGLPQGEETLAKMRGLAAADAMRGWILFLEGSPISYLYAPAESGTLIYAYLGYEPDFAHLSPGTVLQFEAMRQLMEEGHFRLFDFTEGEGQHKRLFSTGDVECVDLLLLKATLPNLLAGWSLAGFDATVALAKRAVRRLRLESLARRIRR
jgi:CelD/BcsL family acetyltransferase involved in cellulose biosynthesis